MTRLLPLALVQSPAESLTDFAAGLERRVKAHAVADLFVYPELHLNTVDSAGFVDRQAYMEASAEPLDGPRGRTLAELAGDLGIWLLPGSVLERYLHKLQQKRSSLQQHGLLLFSIPA